MRTTKRRASEANRRRQLLQHNFKETARTFRQNSRHSQVRGESATYFVRAATKCDIFSPSKMQFLVTNSKKTIAFGERLQFTIRDAEMDELLTVATSLVRANRRVVLNKLMSNAFKHSKHESWH